MTYPPDWPRCACGAPVLDGHLTCGAVGCDEAGARQRRDEAWIGTTIRPSHSCFDDAIDFLERRVRADASLAFDDRLRLVHGIVLAPAGRTVGPIAEGTPYAHAWIEEADLVWQSGILEDGQRVEYAVSRADFYAELRVQASTVYTIREVWIENQRSGHYGPWRPEYRALCRRRGELNPSRGSDLIPRTSDP